jgi:Ca2+-binding EF-hand superfamily protein
MVLEVSEDITDEEIEQIFERLDPQDTNKCSFMAFYKCMQEVVRKRFN